MVLQMNAAGGASIGAAGAVRGARYTGGVGGGAAGTAAEPRMGVAVFARAVGHTGGGGKVAAG